MTEPIHTDLPQLRVGKHTARLPIIQGGMGIRISGARLAGAVAKEGAVGVIASVALGIKSSYYKKKKDYFEANKLALRDEIAMARKTAPDGVIGVNCMVAITDYEAMSRTAAENGANLIISGAGLPLQLPSFTKDFPDCALVPIVSTAKAAQVLCRRWEGTHGRLPDAFVVENPNTAGGHLGASREQLGDPVYNLEKVIPEIIEYLDSEGYDIPVLAAGGVWDRTDIDRMFEHGASGVQMATRFVCTHECDADDVFKLQFLKRKPSDVVIVDSPAGLPGRAIGTELVQRIQDGGKVAMQCFANCLKKCLCRDDKTTFCIAYALDKAVRGNLEEGLFFTGSNLARSESIVSVRELLEELCEALTPAQAPALV
ncbi:MAG: nitronate monooxygenase family protein [Nitrospirota bacterium]|nr:nitronate monooxygenase family protein [Nitrospirota bacterium]